MKRCNHPKLAVWAINKPGNSYYRILAWCEKCGSLQREGIDKNGQYKHWVKPNSMKT